MSRLATAAAQLGVAVAGLLAWELASRLQLIDPDLLPPFSVVLRTMGTLLGDPEFRANAGVTLLRVAVAFLIAAPLALSAGFLLGERLHLGRLLSPLMHFVLAVPQSVFLPIFLLVFGIGFLEKIVFGITHVFFVLSVVTIAAVRSIPRSHLLAARSYGATPLQIYRHIYVPAMLPLLLNGLRLGMVFNITGILLAEMYSSTAGLGTLIFSWGESFQMARMMAATLWVSGATILFNEAMRRWESSSRAARAIEAAS